MNGGTGEMARSAGVIGAEPSAAADGLPEDQGRWELFRQFGDGDLKWRACQGSKKLSQISLLFRR